MNIGWHRWLRRDRSTEVRSARSLDEVFGTGLQWSYDHRARFYPFTPSGRPASFQLKAFGELAYCLTLVLRAAPRRLRGRVEPLAHWVLDIVSDCAFGSLLAEEPQLLPLLDVLELLEHDLDVEGRLASLPTRRHLLDHSDGRNVDGWPFQRLGLACARGGSQREIQELFGGTLVSGDPQLASLSDLDTYAITHALFHVSGVVGDLPPWLDEDRLDAMRWTVEVLLGMTVRSDDLDLLVELVVCHSILRCADEGVVKAAWGRLAAAQDRTGFVPGPAYDPASRAELERAEQLEYDFLSAYHTTLATLLAAALALSRPGRLSSPPRAR